MCVPGGGSLEFKLGSRQLTHSFAHRLQTIENFTFYDAAQFVAEAEAKTLANS